MNKAILAVAVLAMAAFAGVMIVGDDADAATEGYTITYSYDGLTIQDRTNKDGLISVKSFDDVFGADKAPKGYSFKNWVAGSAIYNADKAIGSGTSKTMSKTQFAGDTTLTPVFEPAQPIVKLVYGDKSQEFTGASSDTPYVIALDDLQAFAKLIGAKVVGADGKEYANTVTAIDAGTTLVMDGFEFKGFVDDKGASVAIYKENAVNLMADGKRVATFTAVFDPVYTISFVVEGTQVNQLASNVIDFSDEKFAKETLKAPVKDNHIFMGWYNSAGEKIIGYSVDKNEYTFATDGFAFTEDTTLYAKFVPDNMTVTFTVGEFTSTQTVLYGEKAMKPEIPAGYESWCVVTVLESGEKVYTEFDFSTPITEKINLYAKAAPVKVVYDVTFEIEGKSSVTMKSDNITLPTTTREGYAFQGWVVKGQSQYVDPMSYDIKSDITFVAVYKEVAPPAPAEPGFFETSTGKCVIILAVFAVGALGWAIVTHRIELPKFKVSRVKADEVVEQVEEEKKP